MVCGCAADAGTQDDSVGGLSIDRYSRASRLEKADI
jgi:hypothetical protein